MDDRKRILRTATLVMVGLALVVTFTGTTVLYRSALAEKRSELGALARREARLIEVMATYGSGGHSPVDHSSLTLMMSCPSCSVRIDSVVGMVGKTGSFKKGWGDGVEFVIAYRDNDAIQFLLQSQRAGNDVMRVPWVSKLAAPMRLALSGFSGTVEAEDYRGEVVLAAYAPVKHLGWGVVAKINLCEMRAPFVAAARNTLLLAVFAISIGWLVLRKGLNPLIQRSQRSEDEAHRALAELRYLKFAMDEHSIVAATDSSGKITYVNDKFCRISQYSREELIGQDHRLVNSGHHSRVFFANLWKTIAAGDVWHGEVCNRAKDGSLYWVETTIVPFKDEAGRIAQYIAIRTESTMRRKMEEALKVSAKEADAANRAKSDFLANMSHEIRTPMTAILGFAENLLDTARSEADQLDCVHTIRRNGEYLLGLINDILDLSKIEAGKMTVEHRNCNPCETVAEVVALMRVRSEARGVGFRIEYIGAIPETVHSDATRLRQILINLIGNAIKFTDSGDVRLVIRLVDDGDDPRLQFDVIDTGRGMSEEQAAKLFQPFMQADNSTTRKFGGTGLGLTISKRFAELLGGDIIVAASELGVGSTFRVTVATGPIDGVRMIEDPMAVTVVSETAGTPTQSTLTGLQGLRILLGEDGPDNQRLIAFVLKKAGADVTVKENGQLALDAALAARDEGHAFDVILMDMQMPVMDGYTATSQLRRCGYTGPIIALTAHAMDGDREKCINAGCDDFATKPIERQKLIETIQQHLVPTKPAPNQRLVAVQGTSQGGFPDR